MILCDDPPIRITSEALAYLREFHQQVKTDLNAACTIRLGYCETWWLPTGVQSHLPGETLESYRERMMAIEGVERAFEVSAGADETRRVLDWGQSLGEKTTVVDGMLVSVEPSGFREHFPAANLVIALDSKTGRLELLSQAL